VANADTGAAVEVETQIAASPETVFEFFTDPDKMIQWMGRSADLDPRSGGVLRCDINGRDVALGEYVELEPPRRLAALHGAAGDIGSRRRRRRRPMGDAGGRRLRDLTLIKTRRKRGRRRWATR